jgi:hypothetical protein
MGATKALLSITFLFHAQVLDNFPLLYIELKKIYRQQDQRFIDILNRVRNNCTTSQDLQILNKNITLLLDLLKVIVMLRYVLITIKLTGLTMRNWHSYRAKGTSLKEK